MKKRILLAGICVLFTACSAVEPVSTVTPPIMTTQIPPAVTTIAEIPLEASAFTQTPAEISPIPINPDASDSAAEVLAYLTEQYGRRTLSGQFISTSSAEEIKALEQVTGRKPAILMADLGGYAKDALPDDVLGTAVSWGKSGGLVSLMWHWEAPAGKAALYSEETDFNLSKAVTEEDIAQKTPEELDKLRTEGKIPEETMALVRDIDSISQQLARLQEEGIPVLWRPLHEAAGGWFWWGAEGKEAYQWLWKLLYDRQTRYHKLNNLLWVWNGQAAEWYVGDGLCDIISADVYTQEKDHSGQPDLFKELSLISEKSKLLAISECGCLPDANSMHRESAVWSYFGLWFGEYSALRSDKASGADYNTQEQFIQTYNSEGIITLDELPEFTYVQK